MRKKQQQRSGRAKSEPTHNDRANLPRTTLGRSALLCKNVIGINNFTPGTGYIIYVAESGPGTIISQRVLRASPIRRRCPASPHARRRSVLIRNNCPGFTTVGHPCVRAARARYYRLPRLCHLTRGRGPAKFTAAIRCYAFNTAAQNAQVESFEYINYYSSSRVS